MIWYDWTYKDIDFSNSLARDEKIAIIDVQKNLWLRTEIYPKQNYHWVNTSNTIAEGRLFTFRFSIFGNREERSGWQQKLNSAIVPEYNPSKGKWLYELSWTRDDWSRVTTAARVYRMPTYDEINPGSSVITGTFELFAPNPEFYSISEKNTEGEYGRRGWFKLDTNLDFTMNELLAEIVVINEWNFAAPLTIIINGAIKNPKIKNLTTDNFYWINDTTNNLVIDNRSDIFIVEDQWVNIKASRMEWSEILRVNPWKNTFIVTWDDFDYDSTLDIDIFYKDTYLT